MVWDSTVRVLAQPVLEFANFYRSKNHSGGFEIPCPFGGGRVDRAPKVHEDA